jgi:nucleoside-diphosphate-sugar epimerase
MTDPRTGSRKRVLVTGATGLVGSNTCAALVALGHEVHGTSRNAAALSGVTHHVVDLTDPASCTRLLHSVSPDIIVHAAWVTDHGVFWRSALNLTWTAASLLLAKEAQAFGVQRFVGIGTCAEYAWGTDAPLSEYHSLVVPSTLYGACKDATRRALESFGKDSGVSIAWARLGMLYGPGEHPARFVASLAHAFATRQRARMSSGRVVRDYMHVRDVGAALAALSLSPIEGPVNIASGTAMPLVEMAHIMARLAGRLDLLDVGALPDRQDDPERIIIATDRLNEEVGFKPGIELERGFLEILALARRQEQTA